MNDQINKAYNLLWEVYAKVRGEEGFEVDTIDIDEKEVRKSCNVSDLRDILTLIDTMCGR